MKRGPRRPRVHGELDKEKESNYATLHGPVKTYTLPPEEIAKIFKGVTPTKKPTYLQYELRANGGF